MGSMISASAMPPANAVKLWSLCVIELTLSMLQHDGRVHEEADRDRWHAGEHVDQEPNDEARTRPRPYSAR